MTVDVDQTRENRETLGKAVAAVINDVFDQGTQITVHWDLRHADTEHSGVYVSAYLHTPSVTRTERNALKNNGLYLVEQASHVTENPAMDDTVDSIPRDELADAAEVDTELILELSEDFITNTL